MPKQTFFNLPDDKKQSLISALEKEFSRVPLHKASIANIVRIAGIPRGSFYQYFKNKEDAFFFLLDRRFMNRKTLFIQLLKRNNGDLIVAIEHLFQEMITDADNPEFMRNVLLNMTNQIEDVLTKAFSDQTSQQFEEISMLIDKQKLNMSDEKDLFHIIQIVTSVLIRNLVDTFARHLSYETATDHIKMELYLLKNGLYKQV